MGRKKKSKTSQGSKKVLTYIAWTLAVLAALLGSFIGGYYVGFADAQESAKVIKESEKTKRLELLQKLEKSAKVKPTVESRLKAVLEKEKETKEKQKRYVSASHEIEDSRLATIIPKKSERKKVIRKKPQLCIIIDDVGTKSQVKAIKSLHIPLTMSFLPPSKARPNTSRLAKQESVYMVHLPMEAQNWSAEEPNTLRVSNSQNYISQRIETIKELFPKAQFVNNHTGSKFTSNEIAMNRLIYALNANNMHFIDSRTTAQTKAPKVLKNFGQKYVARDVFLDHHMEKSYVKEQIKKAIKLAKSHGSAIAIGHPHKNTLQALYESKNLLKEVDLVYINRLE